MNEPRRVARRPGGTKEVDTIRDPEVHLRCFVGEDPVTPYESGIFPSCFQSTYAPLVDAELLQAYVDADTYPAPAYLFFALPSATPPQAHTLQWTIDYEDVGQAAPQTATYVCDVADAVQLDQHLGFVFLFTFGAPAANPDKVASHFSEADILVIDVSEDSESGFPALAQVALLDETDTALASIDLSFVNIMPDIELEEPNDPAGAPPLM